MIARYHRLLDALEAEGMTPLVTLNHYTLPRWLHDPVRCHQGLAGCENRGWADRRRAVREAAKYAAFVAHDLEIHQITVRDMRGECGLDVQHRAVFKADASHREVLNCVGLMVPSWPHAHGAV